MKNEHKLDHPWLVAVWPGMGHVALSAGYYLMAKLGMHQMAEFSTGELFDVDHVEVSHGKIQKTRRPRNRFFGWKAPDGGRDIVVFIGEAQPPLGKYSFCEKLIDFARDLDVGRVFTFAAMATSMRPEDDSRVFAAATDDDSLKAIDQPELRPVEEGQIGGLNGVLLGAAVDKGMQGICLLGEMPHIFAQVPFPKASLAVLKVFCEMAGLKLDFQELADQSDATEQQLVELISKLETQLQPGSSEEPAEEFNPMPHEEGLPDEDMKRIESLFDEAGEDRTKAYELKRELDRLGVFKEFEDRFLDLFKHDQ